MISATIRPVPPDFQNVPGGRVPGAPNILRIGFFINIPVKKLISTLILAACLLPAVALADVANITSLAVNKAPLKVSFQVEGAFSAEMEEAVKSGLPASFLFVVKLDKVNPIMPNESVGTWEFKHTVKYNSLHDEYELTLDEAGGRPMKVNNAEEMKKIMASFEAPAMELQLVPGANYRVRVKAELGSMDLPFIINYMQFFFEAFKFQTDWHEYDFTN